MEPIWPKKKTRWQARLDFDWEKPVITIIIAVISLLIPAFESLTIKEAAPKLTIQPAVEQSNVSPTSDRLVMLDSRDESSSVWTSWKTRTAIIVGAAFIVVAFVSMSCKARKKRMYDPTWEIHFEEEFDGDFMTESRSKAAAILLLFSKTQDWDGVPNKHEIEPVFDFFDNLGFYLYGGQLSDRLLHQGFCHFLLIYWQEGFSYIQERQKVEKSTWEYIENLANEVFQIECHKQGCSMVGLKLDAGRYKKYLIEELEMNEKNCNEFKSTHPEFFEKVKVEQS